MKNLLIDLLNIPGVCGFEESVRRKIKDLIRHRVDRLETDALGNLIATQEGRGGKRTAALFAHMDELGLVISNITSDGFLRFRVIGGLDERVLPSAHLKIMTGNGKKVNGVVAWLPPHLLEKEDKDTKKAVPASKMLIDVGAVSREEVEALGIRVGDPVCFQKQISTLTNDCLAARGMDNRAGCAVLINVLEAMADVKERPPLHYVFTVQEEYGLRGAVTAGYALQPDLCLVVDTASAPDFPGIPPVYRDQFRLGSGPVLRLVDNRMITGEKWIRWAEDLAQGKRFPLQRGVTGGSTDAAALQLARQGLAVLPLCIPCRYTHSLMEMVSLKDLEVTAALLKEMLFNLPRE